MPYPVGDRPDRLDVAEADYQRFAEIAALQWHIRIRRIGYRHQQLLVNVNPYVL